MAEVDSAKTLTLAEQYSLPPNEEKPAQDEKPVESTEDEKPATASDDVVVEEKAEEKTDETPLSGETPASDENPVSEGAPPSEESPVSEENSNTIEQQDSSDQDASEDSEEAPEITLQTAPADVRFPTTNQTRHCFTRYIEYHRCIAARGEGAPECDRFAKYYRSLCPGEWVDRWNEQRENGTFPGPL